MKKKSSARRDLMSGSGSAGSSSSAMKSIVRKDAVGHLGDANDVGEQLRRLVRSCEARQCYSSAVYFADKLVTISSSSSSSGRGSVSRSENADHDIYMLARLYHQSGEHRRAYHILQSSQKFATNLKAQHLAACCLIECKEWDEALAVLGEDEDEAQRRMEDQEMLDEQSLDDSALSLRSAVCFARGRVYEALENRRRSIYWYKHALQHDVRCYEAFQRLVQERALTCTEEKELMLSLNFPDGTQWLKDLYMCQIEQYDQGSDAIEGRVSSLGKLNLNENLDVLSHQAEHAFYRNEFRRAFNIAKRIIEKDPFHSVVLPVYICSLVEMSMKSELFYCAHQLVETYPTKAVAWFAVGAYYYLVRRYEVARRYFSKATSIDSHFAPAWIGFGHSFAAQDESDQAMAAYRTAERIFKGSHIGLLCLGMEFLRTSNLRAALTFFKKSAMSCPSDPLVYNELGVVCYMEGEYREAIGHFGHAIDLVSYKARSSWESTFFNLGHAYRKIGDYEQAKRQYETALSMAPKKASVLSVLGFTYHLQGRLDEAVDFYHKALGIHSRDTFTSDLLTRALSEMLGTVRIHHDH